VARGTHLILLGLLSLTGSAYVCEAAGGGQAAQRADSSSPMSREDSSPSDYVIGADDVLSVVFWGEQQLSSTDVLVRPDGKISIPLLDDIPAAGLTPEQLRDRIVSEARRFLNEPVATVVVRQINSRKVYITGLVANPGAYPLTTPMTVLQLIATAGGLQDFAKSKDIRIVRVDPQGRRVSLRFNYDETAKGEAQDIELRLGDTVVVP
jgi:polysaccharide export outer membrane protein